MCLERHPDVFDDIDIGRTANVFDFQIKSIIVGDAASEHAAAFETTVIVLRR